MYLPKRLVFFRHCHSEGNQAHEEAQAGDNRRFTRRFRQTHNRRWRLTPKGRRQARAMGAWLRKNGYWSFDRCITSDFLRVSETAGLMGIPQTLWIPEPLLVERDWGEMEGMPLSEQMERHPQSVRRRSTDPLYWRSLNGETRLNLMLRGMYVVNELRRPIPYEQVIIGTHDEMLGSLQFRFEHLTVPRWQKRLHSRDPRHKVHNGQIIIYSRENPRTGELTDEYKWVMSVCPWDLSLSFNRWKPIRERRFTNAQLLAYVRKHPPILSR